MLKLHRCAIKPPRGSERANKRKTSKQIVYCYVQSLLIPLWHTETHTMLNWLLMGAQFVLYFHFDAIVCVCENDAIETRERFYRKLKRCYNPFSFVMFLYMWINVDLFLLVAPLFRLLDMPYQGFYFPTTMAFIRFHVIFSCCLMCTPLYTIFFRTISSMVIISEEEIFLLPKWDFFDFLLLRI